MNRYLPIAAALTVAAGGIAFGLATTAGATVNNSYYVVSPNAVVVGANSNGNGSASCLSGDTLLSGGYQVNNSQNLTVQDNNPDGWSVASSPGTSGSAPTSWYVQVQNNDNVARSLYVFAICLDT